jgi:hypothetical protein
MSTFAENRIILDKYDKIRTSKFETSIEHAFTEQSDRLNPLLAGLLRHELKKVMSSFSDLELRLWKCLATFAGGKTCSYHKRLEHPELARL